MKIFDALSCLSPVSRPLSLYHRLEILSTRFRTRSVIAFLILLDHSPRPCEPLRSTNNFEKVSDFDDVREENSPKTLTRARVVVSSSPGPTWGKSVKIHRLHAGKAPQAAPRRNSLFKRDPVGHLQKAKGSEAPEKFEVKDHYPSRGFFLVRERQSDVDRDGRVGTEKATMGEWKPELAKNSGYLSNCNELETILFFPPIDRFLSSSLFHDDVHSWNKLKLMAHNVNPSYKQTLEAPNARQCVRDILKRRKRHSTYVNNRRSHKKFISMSKREVGENKPPEGFQEIMDYIVKNKTFHDKFTYVPIMFETVTNHLEAPHSDETHSGGTPGPTSGGTTGGTTSSGASEGSPVQVTLGGANVAATSAGTEVTHPAESSHPSGEPAVSTESGHPSSEAATTASNASPAASVASPAAIVASEAASVASEAASVASAAESVATPAPPAPAPAASAALAPPSNLEALHPPSNLAAPNVVPEAAPSVAPSPSEAPSPIEAPSSVVPSNVDPKQQKNHHETIAEIKNLTDELNFRIPQLRRSYQELMSDIEKNAPKTRKKKHLSIITKYEDLPDGNVNLDEPSKEGNVANPSSGTSPAGAESTTVQNEKTGQNEKKMIPGVLIYPIEKPPNKTKRNIFDFLAGGGTTSSTTTGNAAFNTVSLPISLDSLKDPAFDPYRKSKKDAPLNCENETNALLDMLNDANVKVFGGKPLEKEDLVSSGTEEPASEDDAAKQMDEAARQIDSPSTQSEIMNFGQASLSQVDGDINKALGIDPSLLGVATPGVKVEAKVSMLTESTTASSSSSNQSVMTAVPSVPTVQETTTVTTVSTSAAAHNGTKQKKEISKLRRLETDLQLVNEVQNILSGIDGNNHKIQKRFIDLGCTESTPIFQLTFKVITGPPNEDKKLEGLGKILKWKSDTNRMKKKRDVERTIRELGKIFQWKQSHPSYRFKRKPMRSRRRRRKRRRKKRRRLHNVVARVARTPETTTQSLEFSYPEWSFLGGRKKKKKKKKWKKTTTTPVSSTWVEYNWDVERTRVPTTLPTTVAPITKRTTVPTTTTTDWTPPSRTEPLEPYSETPDPQALLEAESSTAPDNDFLPQPDKTEEESGEDSSTAVTLFPDSFGQKDLDSVPMIGVNLGLPDDEESAQTAQEYSGIPSIFHDIGEYNKSVLHDVAEKLLTTTFELPMMSTDPMRVQGDEEEVNTEEEMFTLPSIVHDIGEYNKSRLHSLAEALLTTQFDVNKLITTDAYRPLQILPTEELSKDELITQFNAPIPAALTEDTGQELTELPMEFVSELADLDVLVTDKENENFEVKTSTTGPGNVGVLGEDAGRTSGGGVAGEETHADEAIAITTIIEEKPSLTLPTLSFSSLYPEVSIQESSSENVEKSESSVILTQPFSFSLPELVTEGTDTADKTFGSIETSESSVIPTQPFSFSLPELVSEETEQTETEFSTELQMILPQSFSNNFDLPTYPTTEEEVEVITSFFELPTLLPVPSEVSSEDMFQVPPEILSLPIPEITVGDLEVASNDSLIFTPLSVPFPDTELPGGDLEGATPFSFDEQQALPTFGFSKAELPEENMEPTVPETENILRENLNTGLSAGEFYSTEHIEVDLKPTESEHYEENSDISKLKHTMPEQTEEEATEVTEPVEYEASSVMSSRGTKLRHTKHPKHHTETKVIEEVTAEMTESVEYEENSEMSHATNLKDTEAPSRHVETEEIEEETTEATKPEEIEEHSEISSSTHLKRTKHPLHHTKTEPSEEETPKTNVPEEYEERSEMSSARHTEHNTKTDGIEETTKEMTEHEEYEEHSELSSATKLKHTKHPLRHTEAEEIEEETTEPQQYEESSEISSATKLRATKHPLRNTETEVIEEETEETTKSEGYDEEVSSGSKLRHTKHPLRHTEAEEIEEETTEPQQYEERSEISSVTKLRHTKHPSHDNKEETTELTEPEEYEEEHSDISYSTKLRHTKTEANEEETLQTTEPEEYEERLETSYSTKLRHTKHPLHYTETEIVEENTAETTESEEYEESTRLRHTKPYLEHTTEESENEGYESNVVKHTKSTEPEEYEELSHTEEYSETAEHTHRFKFKHTTEPHEHHKPTEPDEYAEATEGTPPEEIILNIHTQRTKFTESKEYEEVNQPEEYLKTTRRAKPTDSEEYEEGTLPEETIHTKRIKSTEPNEYEEEEHLRTIGHTHRIRLKYTKPVEPDENEETRKVTPTEESLETLDLLEKKRTRSTESEEYEEIDHSRGRTIEYYYRTKSEHTTRYAEPDEYEETRKVSPPEEDLETTESKHVTKPTKPNEYEETTETSSTEEGLEIHTKSTELEEYEEVSHNEERTIEHTHGTKPKHSRPAEPDEYEETRKVTRPESLQTVEYSHTKHKKPTKSEVEYEETTQPEEYLRTIGPTHRTKPAEPDENEETRKVTRPEEDLETIEYKHTKYTRFTELEEYEEATQSEEYLHTLNTKTTEPGEYEETRRSTPPEEGLETMEYRYTKHAKSTELEEYEETTQPGEYLHTHRTKPKQTIPAEPDENEGARKVTKPEEGLETMEYRHTKHTKSTELEDYQEATQPEGYLHTHRTKPKQTMPEEPDEYEETRKVTKPEEGLETMEYRHTKYAKSTELEEYEEATQPEKYLHTHRTKPKQTIPAEPHEYEETRKVTKPDEGLETMEYRHTKHTKFTGLKDYEEATQPGEYLHTHRTKPKQTIPAEPDENEETRKVTKPEEGLETMEHRHTKLTKSTELEDYEEATQPEGYLHTQRTKPKHTLPEEPDEYEETRKVTKPEEGLQTMEYRHTRHTKSTELEDHEEATQPGEYLHTHRTKPKQTIPAEPDENEETEKVTKPEEGLETMEYRHTKHTKSTEPEEYEEADYLRTSGHTHRTKSKHTKPAETEENAETRKVTPPKEDITLHSKIEHTKLDENYEENIETTKIAFPQDNIEQTLFTKHYTNPRPTKDYQDGRATTEIFQPEEKTHRTNGKVTTSERYETTIEEFKATESERITPEEYEEIVTTRTSPHHKHTLEYYNTEEMTGFVTGFEKIGQSTPCNDAECTTKRKHRKHTTMEDISETRLRTTEEMEESESEDSFQHHTTQEIKEKIITTETEEELEQERFTQHYKTGGTREEVENTPKHLKTEAFEETTETETNKTTPIRMISKITSNERITKMTTARELLVGSQPFLKPIPSITPCDLCVEPSTKHQHKTQPTKPTYKITTVTEEVVEGDLFAFTEVPQTGTPCEMCEDFTEMNTPEEKHIPKFETATTNDFDVTTSTRHASLNTAIGDEEEGETFTKQEKITASETEDREFVESTSRHAKPEEETETKKIEEDRTSSRNEEKTVKGITTSGLPIKETEEETESETEVLFTEIKETKQTTEEMVVEETDEETGVISTQPAIKEETKVPFSSPKSEETEEETGVTPLTKEAEASRRTEAETTKEKVTEGTEKGTPKFSSAQQPSEETTTVAEVERKGTKAKTEFETEVEDTQPSETKATTVESQSSKVKSTDEELEVSSHEAEPEERTGSRGLSVPTQREHIITEEIKGTGIPSQFPTEVEGTTENREEQEETKLTSIQTDTEKEFTRTVITTEETTETEEEVTGEFTTSKLSSKNRPVDVSTQAEANKRTRNTLEYTKTSGEENAETPSGAEEGTTVLTETKVIGFSENVESTTLCEFCTAETRKKAKTSTEFNNISTLKTSSRTGTTNEEETYESTIISAEETVSSELEEQTTVVSTGEKSAETSTEENIKIITGQSASTVVETKMTERTENQEEVGETTQEGEETEEVKTSSVTSEVGESVDNAIAPVTTEETRTKPETTKEMTDHASVKEEVGGVTHEGEETEESTKSSLMPSSSEGVEKATTRKVGPDQIQTETTEVDEEVDEGTKIASSLQEVEESSSVRTEESTEAPTKQNTLNVVHTETTEFGGVTHEKEDAEAEFRTTTEKIETEAGVTGTEEESVNGLSHATLGEKVSASKEETTQEMTVEVTQSEEKSVSSGSEEGVESATEETTQEITVRTHVQTEVGGVTHEREEGEENSKSSSVPPGSEENVESSTAFGTTEGIGTGTETEATVVTAGTQNELISTSTFTNPEEKTTEAIENTPSPTVDQEEVGGVTHVEEETVEQTKSTLVPSDSEENDEIAISFLTTEAETKTMEVVTSTKVEMVSRSAPPYPEEEFSAITEKTTKVPEETTHHTGSQEELEEATTGASTTRTTVGMMSGSAPPYPAEEFSDITEKTTKPPEETPHSPGSQEELEGVTTEAKTTMSKMGTMSGSAPPYPAEEFSAITEKTTKAAEEISQRTVIQEELEGVITETETTETKVEMIGGSAPPYPKEEFSAITENKEENTESVIELTASTQGQQKISRVTLEGEETLEETKSSSVPSTGEETLNSSFITTEDVTETMEVATGIETRTSSLTKPEGEEAVERVTHEEKETESSSASSEGEEGVQNATVSITTQGNRTETETEGSGTGMEEVSTNDFSRKVTESEEEVNVTTEEMTKAMKEMTSRTGDQDKSEGQDTESSHVTIVGTTEELGNETEMETTEVATKVEEELEASTEGETENTSMITGQSGKNTEISTNETDVEEETTSASSLNETHGTEENKAETETSSPGGETETRSESETETGSPFVTETKSVDQTEVEETANASTNTDQAGKSTEISTNETDVENETKSASSLNKTQGTEENKGETETFSPGGETETRSESETETESAFVTETKSADQTEVEETANTLTITDQAGKSTDISTNETDVEDETSSASSLNETRGTEKNKAETETSSPGGETETRSESETETGSPLVTETKSVDQTEAEENVNTTASTTSITEEQTSAIKASSEISSIHTNMEGAENVSSSSTETIGELIGGINETTQISSNTSLNITGVTEEGGQVDIEKTSNTTQAGAKLSSTSENENIATRPSSHFTSFQLETTTRGFHIMDLFTKAPTTRNSEDENLENVFTSYRPSVSLSVTTKSLENESTSMNLKDISSDDTFNFSNLGGSNASTLCEFCTGEDVKNLTATVKTKTKTKFKTSTSQEDEELEAESSTQAMKASTTNEEEESTAEISTQAMSGSKASTNKEEEESEAATSSASRPTSGASSLVSTTKNIEQELLSLTEVSHSTVSVDVKTGIVETETTESVVPSTKSLVIVVNYSGKKIDKLNETELEKLLNKSLSDVDLQYMEMHDVSEGLDVSTLDDTFNVSTFEETSDSNQQRKPACTKEDFLFNRKCSCDVDSFLKLLHKKIEGKSRIDAKEYDCGKFNDLKEGLVISNKSEPLNRRKRSLFYLGNKGRREEVLQIDWASLEEDYELNETDSSIYALPGSKVKIPCKNKADFILEHKGVNYVWKYKKDPSENEVTLPGGDVAVILSNIEVKDCGNYTCKKTAPDGKSEEFVHEVEIVTLPVYTVQTYVIYAINDSCSLGAGDILFTYLPKILGTLLCGEDNRICKVEVQRPKCVTQDDDSYFNVTLDAKIKQIEEILPKTDDSKCNLNCKMNAYVNIVGLVNKNAEIIQSIPVLSTLESHLSFLTNVSKALVKAPRILASCIGGFGVEREKQRLCVLCPKNTYSDDDAAFCKLCPAGQYQPLPGSKSCLTCSSPVEDTLCLKMLYSDTKLFKIYVAVGFGVFLLIILLILCWRGSSPNQYERNVNHYSHTRHRMPKRRDIDVEKAALEPLLRSRQEEVKRNAPPKVPPLDF